MHFKLLAFLAISSLAAAAHASVPVRNVDGVLVDPSGNTLYTFVMDAQGKSYCNLSCALAWPPLLMEPSVNDGDFSVVQRDDGSKQWAFRGKPLYSYMGDRTPGAARGSLHSGGMWQVVRPNSLPADAESVKALGNAPLTFEYAY